MNGAAHYRIAEQLLAQAEQINNDLADNPRRPPVHEALNNGMQVLVQFAQVHATLAVAAAHAGVVGGDWTEVLG